MKDREFDPCPCCGADALVYDKRVEGIISDRLSAALGEGIGYEMAPRWTCDCWKRVRCDDCGKCAEHCDATQKSQQMAAQRRFLKGSNAKEAAKRQQAFGFEFPEKETPMRGSDEG